MVGAIGESKAHLCFMCRTARALWTGRYVCHSNDPNVLIVKGEPDILDRVPCWDAIMKRWVMYTIDWLKPTTKYLFDKQMERHYETTGIGHRTAKRLGKVSEKI